MKFAQKSALFPLHILYFVIERLTWLLSDEICSKVSSISIASTIISKGVSHMALIRWNLLKSQLYSHYIYRIPSWGVSYGSLIRWNLLKISSTLISWTMFRHAVSHMALIWWDLLKKFFGMWWALIWCNLLQNEPYSDVISARPNQSFMFPYR